MTPRLFIAAAIVAVPFAAQPAFAQTAAAKAPVPVAKPITRAEIMTKLQGGFKNVDANGDGSIVVTEMQSAIEREAAEANAKLKARQQDSFNKLDTNKDGKLTLAEYQSQTSIRARPGVAAQKLAEYDTDKNQKVTPAEYNAPMLAEFEQVDTNKDGSLSVAEQKASAGKR